jgi:hypothetical protein
MYGISGVRRATSHATSSPVGFCQFLGSERTICPVEHECFHYIAREVFRSHSGSLKQPFTSLSCDASYRLAVDAAGEAAPGERID